MYVCMYVCMYVSMYVCMLVCLSVYACSYAADAKELHEFSACVEPLSSVLRGGLQPTHKAGDYDVHQAHIHIHIYCFTAAQLVPTK